MQRKKWEGTVCFVCDYWWLLLLIIFLALVTVFTSNIWSPLLGFPDNPSDEEPLPTETAWKIFNDPELGYSIQYPSEWEVNLPDIKQQDGYIESVILANQKGITSQTRLSNENARVWVISYPKEDTDFQAWVITHWNWLDGQMEESEKGNYRSLKANVNPAESAFLHSFLWVERENDILCFWAQTDMTVPEGKITVQKMFDLITFSP
jgi:hypothetical protein